MIYMLGPLIKEKIKTTISIEEVQRIILNPEADVLYGSVSFIKMEVNRVVSNHFCF